MKPRNKSEERGGMSTVSHDAQRLVKTQTEMPLDLETWREMVILGRTVECGSRKVKKTFRPKLLLVYPQRLYKINT